LAKTIKDMARELGVSPATVSRALTGNSRISEETRLRVETAARRAGYVPNRAAQSLKGRRSSGFVGLVLTDPGYGRDDSYLAEFLNGVGRGLSRHGIDLFLSAIPEDGDELKVIRNIVETRRADGLILVRTLEADPRVDYLLDEGFPFVTHGRVSRDDARVWYIDTDGAAAFASAFDMLYGLGHRRFGLLTMTEQSSFRLHRTEGLMRAIDDRGDASVSLRIAATPRFDTARRHAAARELLAGPERPTAVIGLFDGFALDLLYEARALGLRVPQDLSVVGFDDIPSAARAGLTTFDAETMATGRQLAAMLVRRLDPRLGSGPAEQVVTCTPLIARATHGPAPAG
jgi:LacI family transcriptional regulator